MGIPINQVFLIVIGTILGGVYFREFEGLPVVDSVMFMVAILITSVGVIALAMGHTLFKDIQLELPLKTDDDEDAYKDIDRQQKMNGHLQNGHLQNGHMPTMQRTHSRSISSESRSSSNNSDYQATAENTISMEISQNREY